MTTTIKVQAHNYPARVQTYDSGRQVDACVLNPEDGERSFYCTTTRELRIMDVEKRPATLGEQRVRLDFNPSALDIINQIKRQSAELIDLCEMLKDKDPRLAALAQTAYEDAAMWAVKAATA